MKSSIHSFLCPCHSLKSYQKCCGPYILETDFPKTPEQLMRSRYTAYTLGKIDYIVKTQIFEGQVVFDQASAQVWANEAKWKRLKILRAFVEPHDQNRGIVEFIAYYIWRGKPEKLHEVSSFQKLNGRWVYIYKK